MIAEQGPVPNHEHSFLHRLTVAVFGDSLDAVVQLS